MGHAIVIRGDKYMTFFVLGGSSSPASYHGFLNDVETEMCLDVTFPPYYFSTHGLSRPATPTEEKQDR